MPLDSSYGHNGIDPILVWSIHLLTNVLLPGWGWLCIQLRGVHCLILFLLISLNDVEDYVRQKYGILSVKENGGIFTLDFFPDPPKSRTHTHSIALALLGLL
jgi:hypothetical protein